MRVRIGSRRVLQVTLSIPGAQLSHGARIDLRSITLSMERSEHVALLRSLLTSAPKQPDAPVSVYFCPRPREQHDAGIRTFDGHTSSAPGLEKVERARGIRPNLRAIAETKIVESVASGKGTFATSLPQELRGLPVIVNVKMARHPRDGAAVRFAETARPLGGKKAPVKIVRGIGPRPEQLFRQRDAGGRIVRLAPLAKRHELGLVGTSSRVLNAPGEQRRGAHEQRQKGTVSTLRAGNGNDVSDGCSRHCVQPTTRVLDVARVVSQRYPPRMREVGRTHWVLWLAFMTFACSDDSECPDGETKQEVCLECGPAGGCAKTAEQCARSCKRSDECEGIGQGFRCFDGVCQVGYCE